LESKQNLNDIPIYIIIIWQLWWLWQFKDIPTRIIIMIIKWIYYYECWNFEDEEGTSDLIEYSLVNDGGGKRSIFVTSFCKIGTIFKLISVFSNTIQVAQNFLSHIDLTGLQLQIAFLSLGLKIVLSYMIILVIWNLKPGHLAKKVAKIRTVSCVWFWKKKTGPPLGYVYHFHIYLFIFQLRVPFLKSVSFKRKLFISNKNTNIKIVFNARYSIHSLRDIFVPNNIFADQFSIKSS